MKEMDTHAFAFPAQYQEQITVTLPMVTETPPFPAAYSSDPSQPAAVKTPAALLKVSETEIQIPPNRKSPALGEDCGVR